MTQETQTRRWQTALLLAVILGVAAGVRVYGLRWGLPDDRHLFSYHPDEYFSLMAVWSFSFGQGSLDPHYYNYGTLHLYLVLLVAILRGHCPFSSADDVVARMGALVLDARLVTVALGVATILLVYLAGRELYGRRTGLIAAAILAVMPLHAVHGHFGTVDVPMTFWVVVCLYFAARILRADERAPDGLRPLAPYLLGGVAAGLAAATKYNGGLAVLFVIAAHVAAAVRGRPDASPWRAALRGRLVLALLALVAAFLIACPWPLLNFREWWGGPADWSSVRYEIEHMRRGDGAAVLAATPPGLVFHCTRSLAYGLTWPLLIVSLIGLAQAARRRERGDYAILVFVFAWYLMIGLAKTRYMRYAIPLLPPLALLSGRLLASPSAWAALRGRWRVVCSAAGWLCVVLAGAYTVRYDASLSATSEHDRVADSIARAAAPGSTIGTLRPLWYCHPPVGFLNGGAVLNSNPLWRLFARSPYDLRTVGLPVLERTEYLVVTEAEVAYDRQQDSADWRALEAALWEYELLRGEPAPAWSPDRLWPLPIAGPYPPPDWLYPFPGISVYRLGALPPGR